MLLAGAGRVTGEVNGAGGRARVLPARDTGRTTVFTGEVAGERVRRGSWVAWRRTCGQSGSVAASTALGNNDVGDGTSRNFHASTASRAADLGCFPR